MPDYEKPKQPKKAGFVITAIILVIVGVIFVGMNIWHEDVSDSAEPTSANPHAVDQAQ